MTSRAGDSKLIEVTGLSKVFGTFTAVRDLSFAVRPGEVLGLVGPNGAGKTTTLRAIAGIIPPTTGQVQLAGHDLRAAPTDAKRALAFFTDEPRLFDYLTVRQHLNFIARLYAVPDHEAIALPLLEELEIADRLESLPAELSRGMKQKLAIACGLLHQPKVVIFDEPMTGLDPMGMRRMKGVMRRLARDGAAIILSSHLLGLVEEVCTHLLILKDGRKVADGTVAQVREQFGDGVGSSLEDVFIRATETATP